MANTDKLTEKTGKVGKDLLPNQGEDNAKNVAASNGLCGCHPIYDRTFTLKDTAELMMSDNYKERFVAEYVQLKIRYEKLKYLLTRWEAFFHMPHPEVRSDKEWKEAADFWLGFTPSCDRELLREQQEQMGRLLHTLEVRAVIEGIDLRWITIKL